MKKIYSILLCVGLIAGFVSCEQDRDFRLTTLTVTSETITPSYESAEVSCVLKAGATISEVYVHYSPTSSFADYKEVEMTNENGTYIAQLTDLHKNTMYYIRYGASNKYSSAVTKKNSSFYTLDFIRPVLTTTSVTQVTTNSAVTGGNVTDDGGLSVTERGVVYGTSPNPTTSDNKITNGTGKGSYTCNLTDLQEGTTYYVRAYAVNEKGTAYGEEVSFITNKTVVVPTVTTTAVTQVTETTAVTGGNVTDDGGASVTERGVVYGISPNPTTSDNKITNGSGEGLFTCNLTGLQAITTYYVRAYAVNEKGTAYGEEISFTTAAPAVPEYVDLGLSVKWATFNVGANYGDWFAWGETESKMSYSESNYSYTDNPTTLPLSADAARVNWGGNWRMPTDVEWTELREQCTWTWTTQNGVNGYKVTSKKNGNSIFLPAAGHSRYDCPDDFTGIDGYYWSSSLDTDGPFYAWSVTFNSSGVYRGGLNRYYGYSVRPVYCDPVEIESILPTVTTTAATQVTETTAVTGGNVTSDGNASVTERGVVYSLSAKPSISDLSSTIVRSGSGTGAFTCNLSNLQAGTTYYVRAYAVIDKGTAYGDEVSFTTALPISLASVTTSSVTNITETTAKAGGTVIADGNATVTERGVCISTISNPTIANSKVTAGSGIGSFTCNLTGLQANTTYYVRAYAINSKGTSYGTEVSFTTNKSVVLPTVTTSTVTQITQTTAVAGGNVTSDGNGTITERGVCVATVSNPTTSNAKVTAGSGTGSYACNLTGLQENTTYYVRAYAVNSKGTAYGEEISFTTKSPSYSDPTGTANGHGYVDLGLSVKWATMNVGASKPEDYGDYFAWGEVETKTTYNWNTYKWCVDSHNNINKYNNESSYGIVDNKTILEPSDDAATVNWGAGTGGTWRMPTNAEVTELREQCTWTWTTQNGVYGRKVTGPSGNSIFLPATGCYYDNSNENAGNEGYYWSCSLNLENADCAYNLHFNEYDGEGFKNFRRDYGHAIRPVYGLPVVTMPTVTTSAVTQITEATAVTGGNVISDGGATVTERGICVATVSNPTTSNTKVTSGSGKGSFTCNLTGLQENTTYYVRAYAINSKGTSYGEEVSFTTKGQSSTPNNGTENGHEYVDLGLSVKWATCNVGASGSKPEDYGDYFAWGETEPKTSYSVSNYSYTDNPTTLPLSADAARANWGGSWRMPTRAEQDELREQCTWTWTTQNGVNGYKVTGTDGNSIFLPAAGYRDYSSLNDAGSLGNYWSSSLDSDTPSNAYGLGFYSGRVYRFYDYRRYGRSVRPVCP